MRKQGEDRVQLRWRAGDLASAEAIRDRWSKTAPEWYWLDPLPVLPLPDAQPPAAWGTGIPDLYGHEPRELRLFCKRSAVHLVREAAGRYRWVELAETAARATLLAPGSGSGDWQTVEVRRRRQPILLREAPAGYQFKVIEYVTDNRVLFWRLAWNLQTIRTGRTSELPNPSGVFNSAETAL
jgi:hypothetical protein